MPFTTFPFGAAGLFEGEAKPLPAWPVPEGFLRPTLVFPLLLTLAAGKGKRGCSKAQASPPLKP